MTTAQRAQLVRLASQIRDGDTVTCTGTAGRGPATTMRRLARERARAACAVLAAANPGLRTRVQVAWSARESGGTAAARQVRIAISPRG
ncbi:MAG: hypothetical protein ACO3IV_07705 [Ilumatobacteraceae bacterium]